LFPPATTPHGDWIEFEVSESAQGGMDLNGDGDALDSVVFVRRLSTAATTNLGLASSGVPPALLDGFLAFTVSGESQGHTDLNGDGDVDPFDQVLFIRDLEASQTLEIPLATTGSPFLADSWLWLVVPEYQQRRDLNGDGDTLDQVAELIHLSDLVR